MRKRGDAGAMPMMRQGAVSCLVSMEGLPVRILRTWYARFFVRHNMVVFFCVVFGLIDSSKELEKCEEES